MEKSKIFIILAIAALLLASLACSAATKPAQESPAGQQTERNTNTHIALKEITVYTTNPYYLEDGNGDAYFQPTEVGCYLNIGDTYSIANGSWRNVYNAKMESLGKWAYVEGAYCSGHARLK